MTPKLHEALEERFVLDSALWKEAVELIELATVEKRDRCVEKVLSGDYHAYQADPKLGAEHQMRQRMAAMLRDVKEAK